MTIINNIVERMTSGDKLEKLQIKAWYLDLHAQNSSYFDSDYLYIKMPFRIANKTHKTIIS